MGGTSKDWAAALDTRDWPDGFSVGTTESDDGATAEHLDADDNLWDRFKCILDGCDSALAWPKPKPPTELEASIGSVLGVGDEFWADEREREREHRRRIEEDLTAHYAEHGYPDLLREIINLQRALGECQEARDRGTRALHAENALANARVPRSGGQRGSEAGCYG